MRLVALGWFLLITARIASGQEATAQQAKPGPEVQKLGYYLGTWKGDGETKGGPFGPAGKLSSTTTCDWFAGGFQLVCRGEENGATGTRKFLSIRAYEEKAKPIPSMASATVEIANIRRWLPKPNSCRSLDQSHERWFT